MKIKNEARRATLFRAVGVAEGMAIAGWRVGIGVAVFDNC